MSTLNLKKVGSLIKVEFTDRADYYVNRYTTNFKFLQPSDGTGTVTVTIGGESYKLALITDIQISGVALVDQADFETKLAVVFP